MNRIFFFCSLSLYLQVIHDSFRRIASSSVSVCVWGRGEDVGDVDGALVGLRLRKGAAALDQALQCQSVSSLEVRVLVHLGGAQGVSSVDSGGGRGADVGLVSELRLVLAVVQGGRGQHTVAHANWNLVDDAWWIASVLDRVACRALWRHQVSHSAGRTQSSRSCVGVEMGLAREVRSSQMWVNVACVRGAIVMEGVRGLSGNVRSDVGLLAPMSSVTLGYHVLLGLNEGMTEIK